MAHWDGEQFGAQMPKDIQCATCVNRLKPVKLGGEMIDRAGYAMCAKYNAKPMGVLLNEQACTEYEKEE